MDTKNITKIVNLMTESDLTEFEIEENGLKLRICRGSEQKLVPTLTQVAAPAPALTSTAPAKTAPQEDANAAYITSPMVGTFYVAASPENPPFVKVGDSVETTSTVCIIEAMKVMNEIQAELKGSITEVMVRNGDAVEFGQPLFKIKLS